MSRAYDIVAYAYNAELYCSRCIIPAATGASETYAYEQRGMDAEQALDEIALVEHIDRQDEASFDSSDFPKVVFRDMLDGNEQCGHCGAALDV